MDNRQKLPSPEVPIGYFAAPFLYIEGDLLRVKITEYPYWTKIKIIKLNENGNI